MNEGKTRILVADDEPGYVQSIIQGYLETCGYEVLTTQDGPTAIELAASGEPDLILLGVRMPDLDGYKIYQRIREFSAVPIIMASALAEDTDVGKGLNVGADHYLTKPFSIKELLASIQAVLRRVELSEQQEFYS